MQFEGFSPDATRFLRELGDNNTKQWFDAHRGRYQAALLEPAKAFVGAVAERLHELGPGLHAEPRIHRSIFQIHRDTRFSIDKTPYKTHLDLWFWSGDHHRSGAGLFFRLRHDSVLLGAGRHQFDKPALGLFRAAVDDEGAGTALQAIADELAARGVAVDGSHYKRVPRGFDAAHPRGDWLRHNALYAGTESPIPPSISTAGFVDEVLERWRPLMPLLGWLNDAGLAG